MAATFRAADRLRVAGAAPASRRGVRPHRWAGWPRPPGGRVPRPRVPGAAGATGTVSIRRANTRLAA